MTIFWLSTIGNAIQLIIMAVAGWHIAAGDYSFFELNVGVFVTQIASWFHWVKTLLIEVFGDFGVWVLSIPILIIAPLKFVAGVLIGWWAYSAARKIPINPAHS